MERRAFLGTVATAVGLTLAGCLGDDGGGTGPGGVATSTDTGTPTDQDEPRRTSTPTDGPEETPQPSHTPTLTPPDGVVVEDIAVRKDVVYESTMGSGGVLTPSDRQFVVATVRTDQELSADAFALETAEGSFVPGLPDTRGGTNWAVAGHEGGALGSPLGRPRDAAYLAFTVPSPMSASTARIELSDGAAGEGPTAWGLPERERERLTAPTPTFNLVDFDAPASVSAGEPVPVTLRAENTSDTAGRFLAAVYWPTDLVADDDESHIVEREVAPGESVTASLDLSTEYAAYESGPHPLTVDGHVTAEQSVDLRDVETDR